jgi:hypothetical protein
MTNTEQLLLLTIVLLLIFSAIPFTAKAALYIGLFLMLLAWMSAWQTGNLQALGNELFS